MRGPTLFLARLLTSAQRMSLVVALVPSVDGKRLFEDAILDYLRERSVAVVDLDDYGFAEGERAEAGSEPLAYPPVSTATTRKPM